MSDPDPQVELTVSTLGATMIAERVAAQDVAHAKFVADAMTEADNRVARARVDVPVGSKWRHFKHGDVYVVTSHSVLEEDCDVLIEYANVKTPDKKRSRRLSVFTDIHPEHGVKRFTKLE